MKPRVLILTVLASAVALALYSHSRRLTEEPALVPPVETARDPIAFACQGRIEGNGDPFEVSAAVDGVIESVAVKEGQAVVRGQVLARIGCAERQAAIDSARAQGESAYNALLRLKRGSRDEERRAAGESTTAARAMWEHRQAVARRYQSLFATGDISRQMFDNAQRDLAVAEASLRRAEQQEQLVVAPPLPEDLARLEADWAAAKARLSGAEMLRQKCDVASPVNGTVVKVLRKEGESVSTFTPQPILAIADFSATRVRAEVDERDVVKVMLGQRAVVRLDDSRTVEGTVSRIALRMGRKSVQSTATSDKNDRDVLDVWITIPRFKDALPLGLRVLVQFPGKE